MKRLLIVSCGLLAGCAALTPPSAAPAPSEAMTIAPVEVQAPSGAYRLDPSHSSLIFRTSHFGLSHYSMRFTRFDATLQLDAAHPVLSAVSARIDAASLDTNSPPTRAAIATELQSADWLNVAAFPEIAFQSTAVRLTGPTTGLMHGDLTIRGVTRPVTFSVTFNRSFARHPFRPTGPALFGVSAHGMVRRSDFGITTFMTSDEMPTAIGDEIEVILELEFTGVPAPAPS